jgi:predicted AlkP superfamily pyrophosphatase or phosphodiesterase
MADLTEFLLPKLLNHRLPDLDLEAGFVYPAYQGYSILNIPASVCCWLGASPVAGPPLADEIEAAYGGRQFQRVILVVLDALGFERLQRWLTGGAAPVWRELAQAGVLAPLTSITPSTTSAAITTFWTGRSPAEHGLTGYEMWFKEYGVVGNTITHSAASFLNDPGGLARAGFNAQESLSFPVMGTRLAAQGIQTYVFQHASILHSGLSRSVLKDVNLRRYFTASDLWINLRSLIENNLRQRLYAYVYWSELDTLTHAYAPDDERSLAEFDQFSAALERLFLHKLSPVARQGVLLILTADHGAILTRPDAHYDLHNHPNLTRRLHIQPTGENRLAYLYVRPGQMEAVHEYIERTWPGQFALVDSIHAADAGLFGPGKPHSGLYDRLGDLIVAARDDAYLWWANKENQVFGRHGGLHRQEMLVPFLAVDL